MSRFAWQKLPKPFLCLAPLASISDSPFRQICKQFGVDVVFTEMISAEGIAHSSKNTLDLMRFTQKERPLILQLFGKDPQAFAWSGQFIEKLPPRSKPDGIDLNCGCPSRRVKTHGSGITLMTNPKLVNRIIEALAENTHLPLSIKIRAGIEKEKIWASGFIQKISWEKLAAITVHGRYLEEGFSGPIDYQEIKKVKEIVDDKIVIANGGICDRETAQIMLEKTGADGLMIGQGALGNPWVFREIKKGLGKLTPPRPLRLARPAAPSTQSKAGGKHGGRANLPLKRRRNNSLPLPEGVALAQAKLMVKYKGEERGIVEMRKHLLWYFRGFPGARNLRKKLVKVEKLSELQYIIKGY